MKQLLLIFCFQLYLFNCIQAQGGNALKKNLNFSNGDIVCSTSGIQTDRNLEKTNQVYQDNILGVFNANVTSERTPLILESGIAYVKFSAMNGTVKKGDYITSSSIPGTAMKATRSGTMLGVALDDSPHKELLRIRVQVQYVKQ